jgi:asparagine synthase (glutamine-hydrolysing)
MCGITGLMASGDRNVSPELLRDMTRRIAHRGPDDSGIYISPDRHVGLGSSRLSIQDLSPAGHMPMSNETGRVWLTFNGEIYNFKQLRPDLVRRGHRFVSETDTEVVIHLYEERGLGFLDELEGMFAIALWDEERQLLLIARDRLGEKPLYYTDRGGMFRFASEIKSLLADDSLPRSLDIESLNQYLTFGFVQAPRTMFEGIHKLAPGERLTIRRNSQPERERFWKPLSNLDQVCHVRSLGLQEQIREVRTRLERSVESCLVADVPVGAFLSGGVDSSTVVSLMSQKTGRRVECVTISYPDQPASDESAFAQMVADQVGANLHPVLVRAEDAEEAFSSCVYHQDEPLSDPACINTWIASRHLRAMGVPVALVGEGADELFLGYPSYLKFQRIWPLWRAGSVIPRLVHMGLRGLADPLLGRLGLSAQRDLLRRASQGEGIFVSTDPFFLDGDKVRIAGGQLNELARRRPSSSVTEQMGIDAHGFLGKEDLLSRISLAEVQMRMAELLLMRVDKLSMAHSIEVRAPFLNWHLAELALALPGSTRTFGRKPKALLKAAVADLIPEQTINRPKMGFSTAVEQWCRTWAGDLLEQKIKSSDLFRSGILSASEARKLLAQHRLGRRSHHPRLWNLLCLAEWWDRYGLSMIGSAAGEEVLCDVG